MHRAHYNIETKRYDPGLNKLPVDVWNARHGNGALQGSRDRLASEFACVIQLRERMDARLLQIAEQLRELQPTRNGSLVLDFYACGKNCLGCSHPRWIQWSTPRFPVGNTGWVGHRLKAQDDPSRRIRRTGLFKEHYEARRNLVKDAKVIIADRGELIQRASRLFQLVKKYKKNN